jgi:hypothetical protein
MCTQFDVAISVSDDCLDIARFVRAVLREEGWEVFLYEDHLELNWGMHLEHLLHDVYEKSKRIVALLGCTYFSGRWTSLEAEIAAKRFAANQSSVLAFWFCGFAPPTGTGLELIDARQLNWSTVTQRVQNWVVSI